MTVLLAAKPASSVCCVCHREIIGVPDTSRGGESAHRHCATRAFQASRREPPIARKYGLCNGAIHYASRDLYENDQTIGISTDDGDIDVHPVFLTPGHEYDRPDIPPGGTSVFAFGYALTVHQAQGSEFDNVLFIDEWFGKDRARWLYTGTTRAKATIVIARRGDQQ